MLFKFPQVARVSLVGCLIFVLTTPQALQSQSKVVQPSELKSAIERASATRQQNLDQVRTFFSTKPVRAALAKTTMSPDRVKNAVSSLSPDELAKLAERTQKVQADFAAGAMTNQELTYIVIALATAVLILVIIKA